MGPGYPGFQFAIAPVQTGTQLPGQLHGVIGLPRDLPEGYRIAGFRGEFRLIDIDPDPCDSKRPTVAAETVFDQDTTCLSVTPIKIVGPFDPGGSVPRITAEKIMAGERNTGAEGESL